MNLIRNIIKKIWSKKIYVIIIVAIIVAGGGYLIYSKTHSKSAVTYQTATVQKGMLTNSISGSGNITVSNEASIKPSISGTVKNLKVSLGDQVTEGQFLFYIESPDTDISLTKSYASYTQVVQSLQNAQTQVLQKQLDLANTSQNTDVSKAKTSLMQAEQSVENAYTSLLQADNDYNKLIVQNQTTPGSVSMADIAIADEKAAVAGLGLKSARQNYSDAQTAYNHALENVGITQEIAQQQLASSQAAIETAQLNVDAALQSYNNEKDQASKRYVIATIAGTITALNIKNGDSIGGSSSSSTSTSSSTTSTSTSSSAAMVIGDLSTLKTSVSINESDISKIVIGQKATLTFDAISDLTLTGKVEKIDQTGTNTQNVITYGVTIGFDELNQKIKPQMNVTAEIVTEAKQDVLYVSSSAVKTSGETHYVQVMVDGVPKEQTVEIGISNDTDTEITSGLKEGDTVVTQTISGNTTTNTSSSTNRSSSGNRGGIGIPGL